jgi:radical S-adenosyl methionine domain-containing protein 2
MLAHHDLKNVVAKVSRIFSKVTFAGGEPTLYQQLPELLEISKNEGTLVNIVTNTSLISSTWLKQNSKNIDFLTLSVDSDNPNTLYRLGRMSNNQPLSSNHYINISETAKRFGINVKLNSVVTILNQDEDISSFVKKISPSRWKILQATPIEGQNDFHIQNLTPSIDSFNRYVDKHINGLKSTKIKIIPESIETIRGSYIMIDPHGRFFNGSTGKYFYSKPILDVGVLSAFLEMNYDQEKFNSRGWTADFQCYQSKNISK